MVDGVVIGGGVTGLAAAMASGFTVLEAASGPGGICRSYYVRPGERERLPGRPDDGGAYRFEIGGGHWIFGGDTAVLRLIEHLAPSRRYVRRSAVHFADGTRVPYPIQDNLRVLPNDLAERALAEMADPPGPANTMREWHETMFGSTLCELFFHPFHERYTAGLHGSIAPQDPGKSPIDLARAIRGAFRAPETAGYNTSYLYPAGGLDGLAGAMARVCDVRYGSRVVAIESDAGAVVLESGEVIRADSIISTLPLHQLVELLGIDIGRPPPHTSVLVLNIGGTRGERMPEEHWLYTPDARSGFHRVGFYSNVDASFVPERHRDEAASLYVERGFPGGRRPTDEWVTAYAQEVVQELRDWCMIASVDVVDPTWIDVAYTWSWPGSTWREDAIAQVIAKGVVPVGRYGRWVFQGIADSIRDGLMVGAACRLSR